MLFLIALRIMAYMKRFLISIKRYLLHSLLNFMVFSTLFMMFISLISWLQINFAMKSDDYEISKIINSQDQSLFYSMELQASRIEFYREIQALTVFSLVLQTLKYLYFSKGISKLLDVYSKAKMEFLFYVIMFSIVLCAFVITSFITFGPLVDDFNTFTKALTQTFLILIGIVDLEELLVIDPIIGPIYYFSFNVNSFINLLHIKSFILVDY